MREDGETCIAFLDDLADSAQKGRLKFQNAETAEAESDSDFEDFGILLRKRVFDRDIARYVGDAKNNNECLTLLFVDLDSFKNVNDTHGHEAGNDVLRELFTKIQKRTRGKGVAYRVGGDEIAVLLPNYELDEALAIAELIRTDYERSDSGQKYGVTASIGVAIFPNHASNEKDLLECADAAMYLAKQRGRNAVVVSQSTSQATQAGMHTN
jgi:diguanylate cyclase (GGDEF)-like protein